MLDADVIARAALAQYHALPRKGKPEAGQWTVVAAILLSDAGVQDMPEAATLRVVSIGVGTKCTAAREITPDGACLIDSHAEALARRGFIE